MEIDEDDAPYTLHLAARLDSGEIVGVVRFHPRDCPWREGEGSWQLRGMATDPRVRGLGAGRALVAEGLVRVAARGGDLVWCDARKAAVGFYERIGFTHRHRGVRPAPGRAAPRDDHRAADPVTGWSPLELIPGT